MSLKSLGARVIRFFKEENALDLLSSQEGIASEFLELPEFSQLLPYRLYDKQHRIFENKTSLGFVLESIPCLGADAEMAEEISGLIREIGEESAAIQVMSFADHRVDPFLESWQEPRKREGGIYEATAARRTKAIKERSQLGEAGSEEIPPRVFRCLFSFSIPKPKSAGELRLLTERLIEKRKKIEATLSRFTHVLDPSIDEVLELLTGCINYRPKTEVQKRRKYNPNAWISEQVCLPGGGVEVRRDGLIFHEAFDGASSDRDSDDNAEGFETCFKSYEATDVPESWSMGLSGELIGDFFNASYRLSTPFFIHYAITFPNHESTETRFRGKAKVLDHQFKFPAIVRMFPHMPREREENLFVDQQLLEGEKFVDTHLTCGLWAPRERFVKAESTLLSLFQKYGFRLRENHFLHLENFLSSLPMALAERNSSAQAMKRMSAWRTTLTVETANFMPLLGEWWGNSKEGMLLNGRRGQLCAWDPFAAEGNLNAVVVGPSGSGKSVFMQDLLMSQLGQGSRVFILDLGRSFEKLCLLLKGQYLFFNQHSNLNLNPFALIRTDGDMETLNTAIEMVASIVATMAMPTSKIDKERADILSSIVKVVWDKKGKRSTIDDVVEVLDQMSFRSELMVGATESLKEGLKKYTTTGAYSHYFYGKGEIDFSSNLVVIETEELKNMPDLQAVILQIFSLTISNEVFMGDRERRSLICIDEAWDLLKSPQMEGFIESMARRLRKYNGALLVGTQGLKDFECSPGARAAFQNSNWLLMLGRDNDSINILKEENLIPMTEYMEKILSSLRKEDGKYSEVFIHHKGTGFSTLCQLRLDPFSAMLYSTRADDFQAIHELERMGLSVEEAIEWMIINRTPLKAALNQGERIREAVTALFQRQKKSAIDLALKQEATQ